MHVSADPKFWDGMNEKFYAKYHGLDKKHKEWMQIVSSGRPIEGPMGRSWSIPMGRDYRGELKLPINALTNYPVQGTGADVMMIARISAYKRIKKAELPCDFISTVHDSICVDVRKEYVQPITNIFSQVFDDLPKNIRTVFGYDWKVPMACECKFGPNMKYQEKILRNDR
jgi:DNA polymerase I-like protein with 3'-5' exonuclease and polymerase domains